MADLLTLLDKKKPIYITNHSGAMVLLELRTPARKDESTKIKIPPISKYPMPLHRLVPYPVLQFDSTELHKWMRPSRFKLWDPEDAARLYEKETDMEDLIVNQVLEVNHRTPVEPTSLGLQVAPGAMGQAKSFMGKKEYGVNGATDQEIYDLQGEPSLRDSFQLAGRDCGVHPKVTAMMLSLVENPSTKKEVYAKLRVLDDDVLTKDALQFILDNSANSEQIRKWAKGELASREA